MKYSYRLDAVKGNEVGYITVFSPLEIGTIIGWGPDDSEPDGGKKWKVRWELWRKETP